MAIPGISLHRVKTTYLEMRGVNVVGQPQVVDGERSGQPDTLYYDDWNPMWAHNDIGLYGAVRFTPPDDFELRAIYSMIYNVNGSGHDTLYFTLVNTVAEPRETIAGPFLVEVPQGFAIIQFDLPEPITFTCGDDFYIIEGPQREWGVTVIPLDSGTDTYRSWIYFPDSGEFVNETGGDIILRAGGELYCCCGGDIVSLCTFNSSNKFFVTEGQEVYLKSKLTNDGSDTIQNWLQYFFVRDNSGQTVFEDVVSSDIYGPLDPGEEITVTSTVPWTAVVGNYTVVDSAVAIGVNEVPIGNNASFVEMRVYDPYIGNWFMYTDSSASYCFSWLPGYRWATGFWLDCYPVFLDSIALGFGVSPDTVAQDVPYELWWGMTMPETLLFAGTIDTVLDGYLQLISLDSPIKVDSGMIFIAYPYYVDSNGNSVCLLQDQTPPLAGHNHCMHVTTFQWFITDSTWYEDNSGDWFMWAFFSECTSLFVCGDMNGDSLVTLVDVVYFASYLFGGGPPPVSMWAADVNGDGEVNMLDLVYLRNWMAAGGPPPDCP
jgi:hypothetical protein